MVNYLEEFYKKYQRPKMEHVTMGFSGIEPVISEEVVRDTVREVVAETLHSASIDCGKIG